MRSSSAGISSPQVVTSSVLAVAPSSAMVQVVASLFVPLLQPLCRLRDEVVVGVGGAAVAAALVAVDNVLVNIRRHRGIKVTPLVGCTLTGPCVGGTWGACVPVSCLGVCAYAVDAVRGPRGVILVVDVDGHGQLL